MARYKEEKREVAATLEDLKFRVAQAERRGKQEVLSSSKLQQRLEDAAHRAAKAEAAAEEAWQAAAAHEAAARDAEGRRAEAEAAAQAADARCQVRCPLLAQLWHPGVGASGSGAPRPEVPPPEAPCSSVAALPGAAS